MKKQIFALFTDIDVADQVINDLHNKHNIPSEEISFIYRDKDGEKVSGDGAAVASETATEGAADGAKIGTIIGAGIGLAASIGLAGPLGPVVTAGPLAAALGIGGAIGAVATGGVTGAMAGGIVGALTNLGVDEPKARKFEERIEAGDVLISVHTDEDEKTIELLREHNAEGIELIEVNM